VDLLVSSERKRTVVFFKRVRTTH